MYGDKRAEDMSDPTPEDRRAAANVASSLSNLLISAGLTMLTILGAFVVIVLKDKEFSWTLIGLSLLTLAAFLWMAFAGGRAVKNLYYDVYNGEWSPKESKSDFNHQAIAGLIAVSLFIATVTFTFSLDSRENVRQKTIASPDTTVIVLPDSTTHLLKSIEAHLDTLVQARNRTINESPQ
jgi:amino acid transporter